MSAPAAAAAPAATTATATPAASPTLTSSLTGAKTATMTFLTAHPLGVAVVGGVLLAGGAYALGRHIAKRAAEKDVANAAAAA